MSPELFASEPYSFKSDIWALGILLYKLMMLKSPWEGLDILEMKNAILTCDYPMVTGDYSSGL